MFKDNVVFIKLSESVIDKLADILLSENPDSKDFSQYTIVFGGKRPALFLRKELSSRLGSAYIPPRFLAMDEFMQDVLGKKNLKRISVLESTHFIYNYLKENKPELIKDRANYAGYMAWSREILGFIEELQLDMVSDDLVEKLKLNAEIGFSVPDNVNLLLASLGEIRKAYYQYLDKMGFYSRASIYSFAAQNIDKYCSDNKVIFADLLYLPLSERVVIKNLLECGVAMLVFTGDRKQWNLLHESLEYFELEQPEDISENLDVERINNYACVDVQAQAAEVNSILDGIDNIENTVVVVPESGMLIPALSYLDSTDELNISMGYPLWRSTLNSLMNLLFKMFVSRKGDRFYAKDYLKFISHPLIKNSIFKEKFNEEQHERTVTRILVHKLEEVLRGVEISELSGKGYFDLEELEKEEVIITSAVKQINSMGIKITNNAVENLLVQLHDAYIRCWSGVSCLGEAALAMRSMLETLSKATLLYSYPVNAKALEKMYSVAEQMSVVSFATEKLEQSDIYKIIEQLLRGEFIAFKGSPLKGLQILGVFETRALDFDNVIFMGMNEGVFPFSKTVEPLVPTEVRSMLGLKRSSKEVELQKFIFKRLTATAKNVHVLYNAMPQDVRSRFLDEAIWANQKVQNRLVEPQAKEVAFLTGQKAVPDIVYKTDKVIERMQNMMFSASALDAYLRCPLCFYYSFVLRLRESEDMLGEKDAIDVGKFIHEYMETLYKPYLGSKPEFDENFYTKAMKQFDIGFDEYFGKRMRSDAFILKRVLDYRVKRFLVKEQYLNISKIVGLEKKIVRDLNCNGKKVNFLAYIDRINMEGDVFSIVDYKTGSIDGKISKNDLTKVSFNSIEDVKEHIKSFQLPLYVWLCEEMYAKDEYVNAYLHSVRDNERIQLFKTVDPEYRKQVIDKYLEAIKIVIDEILNKEVPFMRNAKLVERVQHRCI